jgi:hypothetical protein
MNIQTSRLLDKCILNHVEDMKTEELMIAVAEKLSNYFSAADSKEVDKFIKENQYKPF